MSDIDPGRTRLVRVMIIATTGWLAKYNGQICNAIFYEKARPQIDTEQLKPPLPKWQSARLEDLKEVRDDR